MRPTRCAACAGAAVPRALAVRLGDASGAAVTINTYARRYGVDRYTAHEDLTAIGFPLPDAAQRWAHRPPPQPRPRRSAALRALPDNDWITMDGRPYFVLEYVDGVPITRFSPGSIATIASATMRESR